MKKKFLLIIPGIILIVGVVLAIMYFNYDPYEMPKDAYINLNENSFLVYEKHTSFELIKDSNVEIISKDQLLENETLGEYKYTIDYKYKRRKYKYDVTYSIKDETAPVFISAPKTMTIKYDDEHELCEKIVYADNYDSIAKCEIVGEYDKKTVGNYYDLEYVISDSSGNENKKTFNLNVVYAINSSSSYGTPHYLYLNDLINTYKNENTSIGIDVSKWQGNVDFQAVKDAGIEFVIMRIGSQRSPEDEIDMDVRFKEYYQACKDVGLKIGVYVYNTAISKEDGIKVAKWVMNELNGDKLDFPIAYDWENWSDFMDYKISLHTLSESYLAFEKELKDNGYDAMLYSSKYYLENVWLDYDNSNIWLAHYTSQTDYKGKYMMWQMTSLARINGITENTVDIDILYK